MKPSQIKIANSMLDKDSAYAQMQLRLYAELWPLVLGTSFPIHTLGPGFGVLANPIANSANTENASSGGYNAGGSVDAVSHTGGQQVDTQQGGTNYTRPGHQLNPGVMYSEGGSDQSVSVTSGNTDFGVLAGTNRSHVNGAVGEHRGYQDAISSFGHIGVQVPGKVTAPGPDYITYDPDNEMIVVWDAKYRGPGGSYPSSISSDKIKKWMPEVRDAVNKMPAGSARDAALEALQSGRVSGQIFRWPK
ncbi:hypothetical protein ABRP29_07685 [Pseudomonas sp. WHRI 8822A]|uniref:hypothetical protein n=1 Tax=Pseudomonas sp. WHRI 8822A TaxID=3162568 RepID=UPI0032F03CDD